jgi:hypothetical protein
MSVPSPPFRSVSEELLYNIYLKLSNGTSVGNEITANDIDTLAKLNSFLTDAVLMKADDIVSAIDALKGNVPAVANSLEKLYNIVQGITYLRQEEIDTIAELNAIISDADLVRISDLADVLVGLNLKRRTIQFYFPNDQWDDEHNHNNSRDTTVIRGKINSLSHDFTNSLSAVSYKSRLDNVSAWTSHLSLSALQVWINSNVTGDEITGTKYWIKCAPVYKSGHGGEAFNSFVYVIS